MSISYINLIKIFYFSQNFFSYLNIIIIKLVSNLAVSGFTAGILNFTSINIIFDYNIIYIQLGTSSGFCLKINLKKRPKILKVNIMYENKEKPINLPLNSLNVI
jgi:hypothetical protein